MSYDVSFCTTIRKAQDKAIDFFTNNNLDLYRKYAIEDGCFYTLCGWIFNDFITALKNEIGFNKDKWSFYIKVKDLLDITNHIKAFSVTEGAKKFSKYIEIFDINNFHIYDPEIPLKQSPFSYEQICWITIDQAYEMKKAMCDFNNQHSYLQELWKIATNEGYWLEDLCEIVEYIFKDVNIDENECIRIEESY